MPAKFEISRSEKNKEFYFHLKATNGEIVLRSQGYKDLSSAKKGIASVQTNAVIDARYELKTAKNGETYFDLHSRNKLVIGTSQMYKEESGRKKGIASVKKNAPTAKVAEYKPV